MIRDNFKQWIDAINNNAENYLQIPLPIKHATDAFSIHHNSKLSFDDKLIAYKKLLDTVNINFKKCDTKSCLGSQNCPCVRRDFKRFHENFKYNFTSIGSNGLTMSSDKSQSSPFKYVHAFSHYLKLDRKFRNDIKSLNIIRILEIIQIMKPSQSSTERVMSHVANTVRNRYESKYENAEKTALDNVNIEIFLRMNSNMLLIDAEASANKFLDKHKAGLLKSKPATLVSTTIQKNMNELRKSKINLPRKVYKDQSSYKTDLFMGTKRKHVHQSDPQIPKKCTKMKSFPVNHLLQVPQGKVYWLETK